MKLFFRCNAYFLEKKKQQFLIPIVSFMGNNKVSCKSDKWLTGMVSTAPCRAASPPGAVKLNGVPVAHLILAQNIRGEVTDF